MSIPFPGVSAPANLERSRFPLSSQSGGRDSPTAPTAEVAEE